MKVGLKMKVGYLGPEGTMSEDALMSAPEAENWEPVALASLADVVHAVDVGEVERSIVPIENTLDGAVRPTLDALAFEAEEVRIIGETVRPVSHSLVARPGTPFESIETVASHPQAIVSCRRFLRQRLPHAAVLPFASSAEAVRLASHRPGWAALGTHRAAQIYGAAVLHDRVDDISDNETRYVWLEKGPAEPAPDPENAKTTITFWASASAGPGWLVRCLQEFAERGVNLSSIESRPRRDDRSRIAFFVDLEGSIGMPSVDKAIAGVGIHAEVVRVLGSYTPA